MKEQNEKKKKKRRKNLDLFLFNSMILLKK